MKKPLAQKYMKSKIMSPLKNENILTSITPKKKSPLWNAVYQGLLFCNVIFVALLQIYNSIDGISYWYLYILGAIIIEHVILGLGKKMPEIGKYIIYLTNYRIIEHKFNNQGVLVSEKDIPRKKLQSFLIQEFGRPESKRAASPVFFFYGILLILLPFNFYSYLMDFYAAENWLYLGILGIYELIALILILHYLIPETGFLADRGMKFFGKQLQLLPSQKNFSGKHLNHTSLQGYAKFLANLSNTIQAGTPRQANLTVSALINKSTLDMKPEDYFEAGQNFNKLQLKTQFLDLLKIPILDVGYLVATLFTVWLHWYYPNMDMAYSPWILMVFRIMVLVWIGKIIVFLITVIRVSPRLLTDEMKPLLGISLINQPSYALLSKILRYPGILIGIFFYTGQLLDFIWISLAIISYYICTLMVGGIIYGIILIILNFSPRDQQTTLFISENEILRRYLREIPVKVKSKGQMRSLMAFRNHFDMLYSGKLSNSCFGIEGNYNRDYRKIMEFEQKIIYLFGLTGLIIATMVNPSVFSITFPMFTQWIILAQTYFATTLLHQSIFSWFDLMGSSSILIGLIVIVYFAKILRRVILLREPSMYFTYNEKNRLYIRGKSIQDKIEISINFREILARGKLNPLQRAENFWNQLVKPTVSVSTPQKVSTSSAQMISSALPSTPTSPVTADASPVKISPGLTPPPVPPVIEPSTSPLPSSTSPINTPSAARPAPLPLQAVIGPAAFPSPYPVTPTSPSSEYNIQEKTSKINLEFKTPKQKEMAIKTEFVEAARVDPLTQQIDLNHSPEYFMALIDQHKHEISKTLKWEAQDPVEELKRFTGLTAEQKFRINQYIQTQSVEIQRRVIQVLHYLFQVNVK